MRWYAEVIAAEKALLDTHGVFCNIPFAFSEAKPLLDGAVHLKFKR